MTRASTVFVACLVLSLLSVGVAREVSAQENQPAFSVERFTPVPGAGGFLAAEGADVMAHGDWTVAVVGSLMSRPIVLRNIVDGSEETEPVRLRLGYDVMAAVGLGRRYQLGFAMPVVAAQGGDRLQGIDLDQQRLRPITLGDLRLVAKGRFGSRPGQPGFALAAAATVTVPTGDQQHFAGERGAVIGWRMIGSYQTRRVRLALNVGPRFRTQRVVLLSPARSHDNELVALAAGEFTVPGLNSDALSAIVEYSLVRGDAQSAGDVRGPSPREFRLGLRYRTTAGFSLLAAAGFGVSPAEIGSPAWRAIAGARFELAPRGDIDRDGVADAVDLCRSAAEDRDGFEDADGCPDTDNDGDGIPDERDECPDAAEDMDRVMDFDGCPEG